MPEYDVAVIGSGTAAQNVAPRCAQAGLRVAVVDRLPYGGTCSQRGCDPKKVLLAAAEAVSRARMLDGRGTRGLAHHRLAGSDRTQAHLHRACPREDRRLDE